MGRVRDWLVAAAAALIIVSSIFWLMPASRWFDVRSVQIQDTVAGISPKMVVDRTINHQFIGQWHVRVMRQDGDNWTQVCNATGTADYVPEDRFPAAMDLDWWTWPVQCKLGVGTYVVRTTWELSVLGFLKKETRMLSNIFRVEAGDGNATESGKEPATSIR